MSLFDRGNFGTFRFVEVSPKIASVCVIIITCIVSPASRFRTRKLGQSTNRTEQKSELIFTRQAIFVFPPVADVLQRSFEPNNCLFQSDSSRLKSFHAGAHLAFEIKYRMRACLTACPIYYSMKQFILGIYISVKFPKKT